MSGPEFGSPGSIKKRKERYGFGIIYLELLVISTSGFHIQHRHTWTYIHTKHTRRHACMHAPTYICTDRGEIVLLCCPTWSLAHGLKRVSTSASLVAGTTNICFHGLSLFCSLLKSGFNFMHVFICLLIVRCLIMVSLMHKPLNLYNMYHWMNVLPQ